jgi:hypothetical protein
MLMAARNRLYCGRKEAICRSSTVALILMAATKEPRAYKCVGLYLTIKGRYVSDLNEVLFR